MINFYLFFVCPKLVDDLGIKDEIFLAHLEQHLHAVMDLRVLHQGQAQILAVT